MSKINAAAVFAPPFFPANKRLPDSIEQVQANVDLQNREEKAFKLALNQGESMSERFVFAMVVY
jgi:hypothetical protein